MERHLHQLLLGQVRAGVSVHLLRVNASMGTATMHSPHGTALLGPLVDPASTLAQHMRSATVVISPYSPFLQNLLFVDHRAGVNASWDSDHASRDSDHGSMDTPASASFNASPVLIEINQVMWRRSFRSVNLQLCAAVGMRYWLVEHGNFSYTKPLTETVNQTTVLRALQSAGLLPEPVLVRVGLTIRRFLADKHECADVSSWSCVLLLLAVTTCVFCCF